MNPTLNPGQATFSPQGGTGGYVNSQGVYTNGGTPAQTADSSAQGTAPIKVNTTIDGGSLGGVQPFTTPTPNPSSTAQNSLGAAVAPAIPSDDPNRTNALNSLLGLESGQNKGQDQIDQESAAGVPDKLKVVNALDASSMSTAKHYDDLIQNVRDSAKGVIDQSGIQDKIDVLTRQKNSDLANIAIQKSVANNDYTAAVNIATKKVAADTEGQQNKINALKDYIQNIDSSPAEKAKMTAAANAQQAQLDARKTAADYALRTASQNGADAKTLAKIGATAADPNATIASIYSAGGDYMQTKTPKSPDLVQSVAGGTYEPVDTTQWSTPQKANTGNPAWGGLSYNGLLNDAKLYLGNNGKMPSLGLGSKDSVVNARLAIQNFAGQLADSMGLDTNQYTALVKANSSAAKQIIERVAKVETVSAALTSQFPRLADLASKVQNLGIQESDLNAGKTALTRKFGSVDAGNYIELINTVRGDYASLQASYAGSRGGQYFAAKSEDAIPLGLSPAQYLGIMQTMQNSAAAASSATQGEANDLVNSIGSPSTGSSASTSSSSGTTVMTGPDGKQYNVPNDKVAAFKAAGGK